MLSQSLFIYCETFKTNLRDDCIRNSFAQALARHYPNAAALKNQGKRRLVTPHALSPTYFTSTEGGQRGVFVQITTQSNIKVCSVNSTQFHWRMRNSEYTYT